MIELRVIRLIAFMAAVCSRCMGPATSAPGEPVDISILPRQSPDASEILLLQSNVNCEFSIDDQPPLITGRYVRVLVTRQYHKVTCTPEGHKAKVEYVQPPFSQTSPIGFVFLDEAIPPSPPPPPPPTGRGEERVEEVCARAPAAFFEHSYALVIGIDRYPSRKWRTLNYAEKDAKGMAAFLRSQGFKVITLYGRHATKEAIIYQMQNYLAPRLGNRDRILIFFAGHGYTEKLGGRDRGYIVPYDGGEFSATYINMDELQTQSDNMGNARHQLFIMDSCFGGLLGETRSSIINYNVPGFIADMTRRKARQILTAGDKFQQVLDVGPEGHSYFTGYLLKALKKGEADLIRDGYITLSELDSYLKSAASNKYQTPGTRTLPGHEQGDFWFLAHPGTTLGKRRP